MSGRVYLSLALVLGGLAVWGSPSAPLWAASAEPATEAGADSEAAIAQSSSSQSYTILHVNPTGGSDEPGRGTQLQPLKTITHALSVAEPSTLILLSGGVYSADTGEAFPLRMRPGVTIQGAAGPNAADVVILGGESYVSPSRGIQNVAILGGNNAGLANVTVSNPHPSGVGVWIESGSSIIQEVAFYQNGSTGVYISGNGAPVIRNSYFSENGDAGLVIAGPSSAQVTGNRFENTGTGISVAPEATPEIADNHISYNTDGLVIHADAQPILENNQILRNRRNSILEYAPWSDALTASAPLAAQPPPPSMTTATAITPGATPQPLAIGGLAPTDDPSASASEPASGQTFATAIGGIATGSEQPIPEAPTSPVPEAVTPNPLFTDPVATAPPSAPPEVPSPELTESSQAADTIAAANTQPASTSESLAYPPPPTAAASPTLLEPLPTESEVAPEPSAANDSLATEDRSDPAIAIAVPNNPSPSVEPLPAPPEGSAAAAASPDAADPSVLPTPNVVNNDSIPDAERRPPTAVETIPDNLAVGAPAEVDDSIPDAERRPPTTEDTVTDNLAVEAPAEVIAFSGPPPTALASFGEGISTELEAMTPALKAVDIAIIPAVATTTLFSNVNLMPTLEVPEAIAVSLAEEATVEADIATASDTEPTGELAADADEDVTAASDPASIRPPTERLVSLTEPSIEIDRTLSLPADSENLTEPLIETDQDLSLSSDSVDMPEAIDLTIIPPPAEDIVLPTVVSRSTQVDRAAAPLPEETSPATGDLPALPSDENSSAAEGARLAVPSADIPVGSGGELPELFATGAAPEGPPAPPSRAAALGLAYRVLIEDTDPALQDQIRQHVPDAFRVKMNGREFIQAGAYPTFDEAQAQAERLNQQGLQAQIERIF